MITKENNKKYGGGLCFEIKKEAWFIFNTWVLPNHHDDLPKNNAIRS